MVPAAHSGYTGSPAPPGWLWHWCHWLTLTFLRTETDLTGAHWCPDPGLGGDPPPRTPSSVSSGACPDVVGIAYRHVGAIHTTEPHYGLSWWSSCKLDQSAISIFFSGVIWNPALHGFPLTVLKSFCSINYTMYINKDFQLEYFVWDPRCDFNDPLISLSSV